MLNSATLLLVLIVFTTVTTVMLVAAALPGGALREQKLWAWGNAAASAGFAIGALEQGPVLVHAGLSYGMIGLGLAVVLRGLRQFCGDSLSWRLVLAIGLGAMVLPVYFATFSPDKPARLVVSGLYLGGLCWVCCATLLRGVAGTARGALWPSASGFAMVGLVMVMRAFYILGVPTAVLGPAMLDAIAAVSILATAVAQVMVAFGLTMLVSHRYAEKLNRLRLLDGLTGALNRAGMEQMGQRVLARARQGGGSVALIMVDADHFKAINDRHGHLAGDQVLVHLAGLLATQVRPGDLVIRYGGEEFVLLLDGSGIDDACAVAQRLRRLVEASEVAGGGAGDAPLRYQVSIGVSCSDTAGYALDALVQRADAAMYRAKQLGRNRVCVDGAPDCL